jgi:hypothetical protein
VVFSIILFPCSGDRSGSLSKSRRSSSPDVVILSSGIYPGRHFHWEMIEPFQLNLSIKPFDWDFQLKN